MPVLVLMYHATPAGTPSEYLDVPQPMFRSQIENMIDAGVSFISFGAVNEPGYLRDGMHVAVTFDDGHATNVDALEFLARKGIRATAFIVGSWAQNNRDYMSREKIRDIAQVCDIGAHGLTHTDLTSLSEAQLGEELARSRAFLEETIQRPVDTMALPGGRGNAHVIRRAGEHGFRLIGNSIHEVHHRSSNSVNRVAINKTSDIHYPLALLNAPSSYWLRKRVRRTLVKAAESVFGERVLNEARRMIRR